MPYLASPSCDCPDAVTGSDSQSGGDVGVTTYGMLLRSGGAATVRDCVVYFNTEIFGDPMEISLFVDGVFQGSTGCTTGSGSTSFSVGAGAVAVDVYVNVACLPYIPPPNNYSWAYSVWAEDVRCS